MFEICCLIVDITNIFIDIQYNIYIYICKIIKFYK